MMISVNAIRRRSSGTLPMFEKPSTTAMDTGSHSVSDSALRFGVRRRAVRGSQHHDRAAGLFDLFLGAGGEGVRAHGELVRHVAVTQDLDPDVLALHQTRAAESRFVHGRARLEALELAHVDRDRLHRERHVEAALRQATLDRRLPTLEVELVDVAGLASLLALHAATAGL